MDLIALVKELGFPIAMTIYLLYAMNRQSRLYGTVINKALSEVKTVLIDLTAQTGYMVSAMISYRKGDKASGDLYSRQAVYISEVVKEKELKSSKEADTTEDEEA